MQWGGECILGEETVYLHGQESFAVGEAVGPAFLTRIITFRLGKSQGYLFDITVYLGPIWFPFQSLLHGQPLE
jgi:hypothetical protein